MNKKTADSGQEVMLSALTLRRSGWFMGLNRYFHKIPAKRLIIEEVLELILIWV